VNVCFISGFSVTTPGSVRQVDLAKTDKEAYEAILPYIPSFGNTP
jgi:hypothetical protein